jgi:Protein of unknown function (DUF3037)
MNDERKMFTYRILRYVPNLIRDEWVNIGVLLEDDGSGQRAIKLIEEDSEFARLRRLNPAMDDSLVRGLGEHSTLSFANPTRPWQHTLRNSIRRSRMPCSSAR